MTANNNNTDKPMSSSMPSLSNPIDIDTQKIIDHAVELFNEQAKLSSSKGLSSKISLTDIEVARAKSNTFIEGLSTLRNITHELDLVNGAANSFKRNDELGLLHSLKENLKIQAKNALRVSDLISRKVEELIDSSETLTDEVSIEGMQAVMGTNIALTEKLVATSSRLIELERKSGGRNWGTRQDSGISIKMVSDMVTKSEANVDPMNSIGSDILNLYNKGVRKIGLNDLS